MTLEDELRDLLQEVRPTPEQEQRFLATAASKASRRQRRRRTWRMVVVPLLGVGCVAAVAIFISSVNWGAHNPPVEHPAVVTPSPSPTASATPTITPLPPLSYQPYPGVSAKRAAEIVTACNNWGGPGEPAVDPRSGTLEDLVDNGAGDGVLIDAPLRADAKTQVGLGPTRSHTALLFCRLDFKRPGGPSVDVPLDVVSGRMRYQDHAIPGPLLVDGDYVTNDDSENPGRNPNGPRIVFIYGRVARNVVRVIGDGPEGQQMWAEIRNGYFLMNGFFFGGGVGQIDLRVYDKAGRLLAITNANPPLSGTPATAYWP